MSALGPWLTATAVYVKDSPHPFNLQYLLLTFSVCWTEYLQKPGHVIGIHGFLKHGF